MLRAPESVGACDGIVIVHDDRTFTCSNTDCAVTTSAEAVIALHSRFYACRSAFAPRGCPKCAWHLFAPAVDEATATATATAESPPLDVLGR